MRGAAHHLMERIDERIVDSLRNFLFATEQNGLIFALDLAMLNIHRGRDHGLPAFLDVRKTLILRQKKIFSHHTKKRLLQVYDSLDDVDLWVGLLAEKHAPSKPMGKTMSKLLTNQFRQIREGDRYWYQNDPAFRRLGDLHSLGYTKRYLRKRKLSNIITDNTGIDLDEISKNVFKLKRHRN